MNRSSKILMAAVMTVRMLFSNAFVCRANTVYASDTAEEKAR